MKHGINLLKIDGQDFFFKQKHYFLEEIPNKTACENLI